MKLKRNVHLQESRNKSKINDILVVTSCYLFPLWKSEWTCVSSPGLTVKQLHTDPTSVWQTFHKKLSDQGRCTFHWCGASSWRQTATRSSVLPHALVNYCVSWTFSHFSLLKWEMWCLHCQVIREITPTEMKLLTPTTSHEYQKQIFDLLDFTLTLLVGRRVRV